MRPHLAELVLRAGAVAREIERERLVQEHRDRLRRGLVEAEDLLRDSEVQDHVFAFLAGGEPEDAFVERPVLKFLPLVGTRPGVSHPSVR